MLIELDDDLVRKLNLDETEVKTLIAMALYKFKGIHGAMAGRILGISEFEFHGLLSDRGLCVNYDVDDFMKDVKTLSELDD